jgi:hypothetical protein
VKWSNLQRRLLALLRLCTVPGMPGTVSCSADPTFVYSLSSQHFWVILSVSLIVTVALSAIVVAARCCATGSLRCRVSDVVT